MSGFGATPAKIKRLLLRRARRRRRPSSLAAQLTIAMALVVALSVIVMIIGMTIYYFWTDTLFQSRLAPTVRVAHQMIENDQVPPVADLKALMEAAKIWDQQFELLELLALVGCGLVAGLAGIVAGRWLAARIGAPVHQVAAAARRVAAGDRTVRVAPANRGAGEIHQLIDDFNMMAREMDRTERDMRENLAAIAHELRTPLTILRGRLQGMRDGVFVADAEGVDGLIVQVDSLAQIIEDLRILSLAMAGRLAMQPTVIDLADEIDGAIDAALPELEAAGMVVERVLQPVRLVADGVRLRQILVALLDNARRYAAAGGIVRIETGTDADGAWLRVLDRGPGFAAADADRLFRRFWRADTSRSRNSGGTGLGLAVVKAIAEAHGGRVSAAPREGGGASFEIHLPR